MTESGLAVRRISNRRGLDDAPRLVLLHGFTQNAGCWSSLLDSFADHAELSGVDLMLVDLPGHGDSLHDDADLVSAAELVAQVGGQGHYLGYSMGGRIALHLALQHPELVNSLTLIGATGGLDTESERDQRRLADARLADRILEEGVSQFLDFWLGLALFADVAEFASCRSEREQNRADGVASSLRACGTGTQRPLWDDLATIEAPTLVIAGSDDAKFGALGERLVGAIGANARLARPAGGHAVHLVNPDQVASLVSSIVSADRNV